MKLILLGAPGSGKGTVSEKLAQDFGYFHLSTGEVLRDEIKKETKLGQEAATYMDKGNLVPDEVVIKIVKQVTLGKKNFILDGFPRTVAQAEAINDLKINLVINLELSEKEVIERISGRLTCEKCEQIFHIKYLPPKRNGICDKCGGKLIQRDDQKPAVVKERFKVYLEKTQPLIDYYRKKKLLKNVDASRKPEEVYETVKKILVWLRL